MPLNNKYLEELSERFVLDLRNSESYRNLTAEQRHELETRLDQETVRGTYPLVPGATERDLEKAAVAFQSRLGVELPGSLREVLRTIDGFIENGVVLYSVDHEIREDGFDSGPGIIEETENLWASLPGTAGRYLFIGDSDLWWFTYDYALEIFVVLSKGTLQPVFQFRGAAELVNDMLRQALNDFDEENPKSVQNMSLN